MAAKAENAVDNKKNIEIINEFICDIECLDALYDYTKEANIFNILKSDFFEIRHSNMLAWLLNPSENHGFEDKFLKKVLFKATDNPVCFLQPYDIELMNFSDTVIYREKDHIDILIVSEANDLVVIIENKVKSGEHDNQLNRYFENIKKKFAGYNYILIYLTPDGAAASDTKNWVSLSYDFIQQQLSSLIKNCNIPEKNKIYINDYITTIRRNIVGDEQLKKICLQIYNKHKAALDLIYENRPGLKKEIIPRIKEFMEEAQEEFDFTFWMEPSLMWIRFIPNRLAELCKGKGKDSWTPDDHILDFEVEVPENGPWIMKIIVGPAAEEYEWLKKRFVEIALENRDVFNVNPRVKMARFIKIDSYVIIKSKEELYENGEDDFEEKVLNKIRKYLGEMDKKIDLLLTAGEQNTCR